MLTAWVLAVAVGQTSPEIDLFRQGLEAEKQGKSKEAAAHYQKALELNPNYGRALVNLGLIHIRSRRVKKGQALCEKALDQAPEAARVHYCLGLAAGRRGDTKEAEERFTQSIALKADNPSPKVELAHIRRKQKKI